MHSTDKLMEPSIHLTCNMQDPEHQQLLHAESTLLVTLLVTKCSSAKPRLV